MKKIRLGVRLAPFSSENATPATGLVELFDIETGQAIEMLVDFALHVPVDGVVSVTAKFFIQALEIKPEPGGRELLA